VEKTGLQIKVCHDFPVTDILFLVTSSIEQFYTYRIYMPELLCKPLCNYLHVLMQSEINNLASWVCIEENLLFYLVRVIHLHFEFSFFCYDYCFIINGFAPRLCGFVTIIVYFLLYTSVNLSYRYCLTSLVGTCDPRSMGLSSLSIFAQFFRSWALNCDIEFKIRQLFLFILVTYSNNTH
jgi:hypothetical protein